MRRTYQVSIKGLAPMRRLILVGGLALMAGCAGPRGPQDPSAIPPDDTQLPPESSGTEATGLPEGGELGLDALNDPASPLAQRIVYFEFDRNELSPHYTQLVLAHGGYLARNPTQRVRLEGHADERGTREYNLSLGEQRAQAVQDMLVAQGASADQIEVISYGEERPAAFGSDEESWQMNRRVELVYGGA